MSFHFQSFRTRVYEIIFEADTPAGKAFDLVLLNAILISVLAVVLESVESIHNSMGFILQPLEWFFTIFFTIEFFFRLYSVKSPLRYFFSFFGIIDFLSVIPSYLGIFVGGGAHYFMVVRSLRLLRIFRILKLVRYLGEAEILLQALHASRFKVTVFLGFILSITSIMGTLMYLIEGPEAGFTSIPRGMYWAIVTLTTVGYGDITPKTPIGQMVSSLIMVLGYGVLAVPTGIVTVELAEAKKQRASLRACPECGRDGHDPDASYCKYCGGTL